jgi:hypothetical protein
VGDRVHVAVVVVEEGNGVRVRFHDTIVTCN